MPNEDHEGALSALFMLLYTVISAVGFYVDYLIGLVVEGSFGSQTSLVCFLALFTVILVVAFPIAMRITTRGNPLPASGAE